MSLRADAERDALAAQDIVDKLRRELARETDTGRRNVLKLRIQTAHTAHQKCLEALFYVDRNPH